MDSPNPPAQTAQKYAPIQTTIGSVLKETWNLYTKNIPALTGLFLTPAILNVAFSFGISFMIVKTNSLGTGIVIGALIFMMIVGWIIQLLGVCMGQRGAYLADSTGKVPFMQAMKEGMAKIGKAIILSIHMFLYTGAWILLILGLIMIVGTFGAVIGLQGDNPISTALKPFMGVVFLLPLIMLVVLIALIGRYCKVAFAFPILLSKEISSKDAMHESIQLAQGMVGIIFWNYFLVGLLLAIISGIATQLLVQIIGIFMPPPSGTSAALTYLKDISLYAALVPSILIGSFSMVFQYAFMKKARMARTEMPAGTPEKIEKTAPSA